MPKPITNPSIDLSRMLLPRSLAHLFCRCVIVFVVLAAGFGGLAFLRNTQRISAHQLRKDDRTVSGATQTVMASLKLLVCLTLLMECLLLLLVGFRCPWPLCQVLPPLLAAVAGGILALLIFDPYLEEILPKRTMLVSGCAFLFFMVSSIHLALWQFAMTPEQLARDFPYFWYALVLLLGATFFGAARGWTGEDPHLEKLLNYRARQWAHNNDRPLLPPPEEDPLFP